jgi:hypothetical protein
MQLICLTNRKFRLKCSNHAFIRQSDNTMTESQVSNRVVPNSNPPFASAKRLKSA